MKLKVGILHPGVMGISVAASAQNNGQSVYWASAGRSPQTHARAEQYDLIDARTLEELCQRCDLIVSVCPPAVAEDVARQVLACSFEGIYLDANAISPQRVEHIGRLMTEAGATFVDGGIVGGPAWQPGRTCLYLSGRESGQVAECFSAGPLETSVIDEEIGKASALKMCFAAYSKGTTALLCAILATAEGLGVREELEEQWSRKGSDFAEQAVNRVRRVTAKAWRFAGEMEEIATTFRGIGLPGEFHDAAGDVYRRMAHFKEREDAPELLEVLLSLRQRVPPSKKE